MEALTVYSPKSFEELERLSATLAKSSLIPQALRGKAADVLVIVQAGAELGLYPLQALRGIYVVDGKPILGADLIVALVQRHGDLCQYFRLVESTPQKAVYETLRRGSPEPSRLTWTIQQATSAGLTNKDNWRKYPDAMLRHRCATALARAVYPDLALGIYCEDEREEIERNVKPVNAAPAPVVRQEPPIDDAEIVEPHVEPVQQEIPAASEQIDTVPFGKLKGRPVKDLTDKQLKFYADLAEHNVTNPEYKYDKAKEHAWLISLHAEMERRAPPVEDEHV